MKAPPLQLGYSSSEESHTPTPRPPTLSAQQLNRFLSLEGYLPSTCTSAQPSSRLWPPRSPCQHGAPSSWESRTTSSLLASNSWRWRFIRRDNTSAFPFMVLRSSSKRAADADSKFAIWLTAAFSAALSLVTAADNSCSSRSTRSPYETLSVIAN